MEELTTSPMPSPKPLDHPTAHRPHRVYLALTNACNRACPWCSTCSSPRGSTYFPLEEFNRILPSTGDFELQLEGGEPTIHPDFHAFVLKARQSNRCTRLVLCTNGVRIPRQRIKRQAWIESLGSPLTLKLSFNHYLWDYDASLLTLAQDLAEELARHPENLFVLNVRLRRGYEDDDERILEAVKKAGLWSVANVFYLQRYGYASEESAWDEPFLVGQNFRMINPDGEIFGPDLIARSEGMRRLP